MADAELMTNNELEAWEEKRAKGKGLYVLIESIKFTLVFAVLIVVMKLLLPFLSLSSQKTWAVIINDAIGSSVVFFLVMCFMTKESWDEKERVYLRTLALKKETL